MSAKLTFTRVRAEGNPCFVDPQSDIRRILPAVEKITLRDLDEIFSDDPELQRQFLYLQACYNIFQIRVVEDPTPIDQQIRDFTEAFLKAPQKAIILWNMTMFSLLNSIYALFARRDAVVDGQAVQDMLSTSQLSAFTSVLPKDLQEKVRAEYKKVGEIVKENCHIYPDGGYVICQETESIMDHIQKRVAAFMSVKPGSPTDWMSMAEACDEAFNDELAAKKRTMEQNVALSLAYPDYKTWNLVTEVEQEET